MVDSTSKKRQCMSSPVEYEPYDTPYVSQRKDLATEPWTKYEDKPTEAQITEFVGRFDGSDVKTLLAQIIGDLSESHARKLLVDVAVSTPHTYLKIWTELTHVQLLKKDELARKIQEQSYAGIRSAPHVQHVKPAKKTQEQLHAPVKSAPQVQKAPQVQQVQYVPHVPQVKPVQQVQQAQQVNLPGQPMPPMIYETPTIYETDSHYFNAIFFEVDYIINQKWARLSASKQYNQAGDAADMVNGEITKIAQSVTTKSHCETKINAIVGLCEIGYIVATGGDCIGAEVRKQVGYDDLLVNTMLQIANLMTVVEKRALTSHDTKALETFDKERIAYCVFDDFEQVLERLRESPMDLPTAVYDLDDDDDYGDIDEQALLNKSDAIEGSASQPITV
jgi:hypothetical protein